ncbi:MAG TPA: DHA2 family efflux MFS transporter permease subunit [Phenylobacterium sp.]|uniref:DHA2 family efflux MFS transporter permease subunit n=1 Tax=Phenylobacterium sp. TaxID=1871053 RepID=UPI002CBF7AF2|nr:DHA2 family efflux MFS transporter permease subunit [Phenylobacterium sp.]HSV03328.1 DHA2 family efflux MFS transporter permease subunit [Phenylobacterium sp.]
MSEAQDTANRWPITISIMLATVMNSLDTTIANVALPHIQGSVSASADQVTWVLTSYIVSAAIMTPLAGWLADRIGRKKMFLISIGGFTVASMLCGIATSLPELVGFRLLQGLAGASLIPLSQAVLLDIYPPKQHGQAMAIWGAGAILGPILGPALGGYLTDNFSWRWCFYINLPVGILALLGVWFFISGDRNPRRKPFDFLGFGMLSLFVGSIQLMLDRGPGQDWFHSAEITTYAIVAAIAGWIFLSHTITAAHPFFDRQLARDRNFVTASGFGFVVGVLLFSTMALLPPMLQGLMGYPVLTSGLVTMPRGIGSWLAMFFVGRLIGRIDTRFILLFGLSLNAYALWQMTHFDLSMSARFVIVSGLIQGFGIGFLFVPLSTLAFATVPPVLRPEGSSLYTLIRNLGSSIGISIMEAQVVSRSAEAHSGLASQIDMSNPVVRATLPPGMNPSTAAGAMTLNNEVTRQAAMVGYVTVFHIMLYVTLACIPLLLLMRAPKRQATGEPIHAAAD